MRWSRVVFVLAVVGVLGALACGGSADERARERAAAGGDAAPTVVYLVRHAEKAAPTGAGAGMMDAERADPELSEAGRARAAALARRLETAGLSGIHTSDYRRTRETAAAVAAAAGVEPLVYDAHDLPALAARLRSAGGRHLVVGHSNTTPELVRLLGGEPGPPISESEYDRLYRLVLAPDGVRTELRRYGPGTDG